MLLFTVAMVFIVAKAEESDEAERLVEGEFTVVATLPPMMGLRFEGHVAKLVIQGSMCELVTVKVSLPPVGDV